MRISTARVMRDDGDIIYVSCGACASLHPYKVLAVDYVAGEYEARPLPEDVSTEAAE